MAFVGTVAGIVIGVAAIAAIAGRTGLPAADLARHALGSTLAIALVAGCGLAAAGLVAGRLLTAEEDEPRRARIGALDMAAIASALAVLLVLLRGPATADELQHGSGAGALLLVLPALVALATGVGLARLMGPVTRLAERAGRGASAAPRLALLALARGRGRTAATAAFLAVSTGLAVFAAVYGATLSEGDRQQAAFRVPLDYTASQGISLTQTARSGIPARLEAARARRRGAAGAPAVLGRPAPRRLAGLPRSHRRSRRPGSRSCTRSAAPGSSRPRRPPR